MNETQVKQRLLEELATLMGRADRIDEHWKKTPPADWEELATFRENDEVIASLDKRSRTQIQNIKRALKRLDKGEWGICVECDANIQEARLKTLPTTTLCIQCAEKREQAQ